jgi:IPT/TIG domain
MMIDNRVPEPGRKWIGVRPARLRRAMASAGLIAAVVVPLSMVPAAAALGGTQILYVAANGSDVSNNCAVASSPCATVGHAVAQAAAGDVIEVASGRYFEHSLTVGVSVTIEGSGAASTIIDGQRQGQVMLVEPGAVVALTGLTIANGRSPGHAGAVENSGTLSLVHDRFVDDHATDPGGAIVNYTTITALAGDAFIGDGSSRYGGAVANFGSIALGQGDTFTGNVAQIGGGAIENDGSITSLDDSSFTANKSGYAGAVDNSGTIGDLSQDTFWGNDVSGYAGAVENVLGATISSVTNDTFAYNSVSNGLGQGGALEQDGESAIGLLANDTIIHNHATIGGGIYNDSSTVASVTGVIVAFNTGKQGANCENFNSDVADSGYNLESDAAASCGFSAGTHDLVGVNPLLRPLGSYGGPTLTAPPWPPSPVISGAPAGPCTVAADQRGVPRPQPAGGRCDIGAVQWAPPAPVSLAPSAGPPGGGTRVHIVGSGFTLSTEVTFGNTPARFWVLDDSDITAISPPGRASEPVRVTDPDGRSAAILRFSYR